ncbi:MAG: glycosyltransferase family 4 protein, partial [Patescibacteria group bacterium]|nr:glycosyltransferase family 4 protein [Patescibacteria group bacterium]
MKFLLITLEFPPDKGGVANYLAGICSVFKNVDILKPKLFRFFWPRWTSVFFQAFKIIRQNKTEMIIVSHVLPIGYVALVFKKLLGIPYIVFTHGMDVLLPQKNQHKKFWLKKILQNARLVVANSEFTQNVILNLIGDSENKKIKTEVIYPCPNPKIKTLQFNRDLSKKKVILTVGRLVARKGIDKVIEAMPKILKELPNAVYMIVGDGPLKKELREIVKEKKLGDKIIFCGDVQDSEMHVYYGMSDIFIMPSRNLDGDVEGFGIVYLEAALFGKPSIAGKDGGAPEAVLDGETGILVNSLNTDEIADAIIRLLKDDELRQRFGANAKERVVREFTWEKQVEKLQRYL